MKHMEQERIDRALRKMTIKTNDKYQKYYGCSKEEYLTAQQDELARLQKELPEMRKENKRLMAFLQDAAAFIRIQNTWENDVVLATLTHDIMGLAHDEPCFEPRVSGYAKAEAEAMK